MKDEPILSPLFQPTPTKPIPPEVRHEFEQHLIPEAERVFTRIAQLMREYGGKDFYIKTAYGIDFGITKNVIPVKEVPPSCLS